VTSGNRWATGTPMHQTPSEFFVQENANSNHGEAQSDYQSSKGTAKQ
jgi:hypothetical protein